MKYRVVAPGRTRLVAGTIIDGGLIDNADSLCRLGVIKPHIVAKKAVKKAAKKG